MDVDLSQDGSSSSTDNSSSTQSLETTSQSPATQDVGRSQTAAAAIAELDKMEKFRFEGQDYNPKTLKEAILRMQDYTRKTQEHAKTVESFKQEQKFYDNLWADLEHVRKNPQLASEFIKLYPEKFHTALKQVLSEAQGQGQQAQGQQARPQFDVETHSRLAKLEGIFHQQEVAKNTEHINNVVEKLSKKYPEANSEVVIARIFEAYNQGVEPNDQTWEETFKQSQEQEEARFKAKYGEYVKKQTQANAKARDVDAGGGTPGRAPKQFKSLKEVTEHAATSMGGRGR